MKRAGFLWLIILTISACQKPEEQQPPDTGGQLTNPYCNDPRAINYNVGFPGIPDNTLCIYPSDRFLGTWDVIDSQFRTDNSYITTESKVLTFTADAADTMLSAMMVTGWCTGSSEGLDIAANKYGRALITNELAYPDSGQVSCGIDTMMGTFLLINNKDSAMNISITRRTSGGHIIHKAIGIKRD